MKKPKPYTPKKTKTKTVSEPQVAYRKTVGKPIRFFSSFEEMNEYDAQKMAAFSPEQHLQHTTELIQRVYAKELNKKFSDYTIFLK